jgi:ABC-type transport system substrate-binding protein
MYFATFQLAPDLINPKELLDPSIRRALYLALDREALTNLAWGSRSEPGAEAKGLLPISDPLYSYVGDHFADSASDPARAAPLFAAAGWSRGPDGLLVTSAGSRLPVEVRIQQSKQPLAVAVADMWKRVGIDSSVSATPPALTQDQQYAQSFPGIQMTSTVAGDGILVLYDGNQIPTARNGYVGSNRGHYSNPRVTELIERFRATIGESERGQLMKQVGDLLLQDAPVLPLFFNPLAFTVARDVRVFDDLNIAKGPVGNSHGRNAHLWEKD